MIYNLRLALSRISNHGGFSFVKSTAAILRRTFLGMLIIPFAAVMISGCSHPRAVYHSDPGAYLVKQLAGRRIIMLADFRHSAPLPFKTLMSLLNEWVKQVKDGVSKDTSIVLVLEDDKMVVNNLNDFIATGNWQPLVKYWLPYNTMEWLEFCADLRQLTLRIDSLNATQSPGRKIHFNIFGGESFVVFDNPDYLKLSKEQATRYFVNVRDSLTARNICRYLDSRKNTKAIVFYGVNHLVGNYIHKDVAGILPRSETGGYFLAHYLKKRLGSDSVLTVCQLSPYLLRQDSPFFAAATRADIYIPSQEIRPDEVGLPPGLSPDDFDGFVTRREQNLSGHPLADVFSKEVIRADIHRLLFLQKCLPGGMAQRYYNEALESLNLLTGRDFKNPTKWESWEKNVKYDGFKRIESSAFANRMFRAFSPNRQDEKLQSELYDLGVPENTLNQADTLDRTQWKDTFWPRAVKLIKLNDSIGLLWVGTKAEKKQAEDYLLKRFGKPLLTPQAYLKLLRYRYYGVKY